MSGLFNILYIYSFDNYLVRIKSYEIVLLSFYVDILIYKIKKCIKYYFSFCLLIFSNSILTNKCYLIKN